MFVDDYDNCQEKRLQMSWRSHEECARPNISSKERRKWAEQALTSTLASIWQRGGHVTSSGSRRKAGSVEGVAGGPGSFGNTKAKSIVYLKVRANSAL
jgi:hypothetical protein